VFWNLSLQAAASMIVKEEDQNLYFPVTWQLQFASLKQEPMALFFFGRLID
jgi:hypothetical protein